jgi:hypothetical protein
MITNTLYLSVMPLVHMDNGLTEQTLTLFPDKNFATSFPSADVDSYIMFFRSRAERLLSSGGAINYDFVKERVLATDYFIVKVVQRVG